MAECLERAVLIVTHGMPDTTTNVARHRAVLTCGLAAGHDGPHRDPGQDEEWTAAAGSTPTLIRHEDEPRRPTPAPPESD